MEATESKTLRDLLAQALGGAHSHIEFDAVVKDFPEELRATKPPGAPHTAWQLLEHLRIAQWDILEFSRDPRHQSPKWPEEYWPEAEAPPTPQSWQDSVAKYRHDAKEFAKLLMSSHSDLLTPFPHGSGQTLLREALVLANHNSYHLGQLEYLKKQLLAGRTEN
jgi:hypothetical protein